VSVRVNAKPNTDERLAVELDGMKAKTTD